MQSKENENIETISKCRFKRLYFSTFIDDQY